MALSASEQATLYFYEWQYRQCGYYHFDTPVEIEPPYIPFQHGIYNKRPVTDDGKVPSLLSSIGKILNPPKVDAPKERGALQMAPKNLQELPELIGFSLSFPKEQEINPLRNREFLNMLSFTNKCVSFEILGTGTEINIRIVADESDEQRIHSHIKAYFPSVLIKEIDIANFGFNEDEEIAIADFGVQDEFMRPIQTYDSFVIDPLTSIIATMDSLQGSDVVLFQVLFKGLTSPLAKEIPCSVSDGKNGSFFSDAPEMPTLAENKISAPLFSVVMRIAVQGNTALRSQYLAQELARSITTISDSSFNKLIPLSNEGYSYDFHYFNVHKRLSNRWGFILNSHELNSYVHFPNKTVHSAKLHGRNIKTKKAPQVTLNQKYCLGINEHIGEQFEVGISDDHFSKHVAIAGATGTGKTFLLKHLLANEDSNNSVIIIEPHGDLAMDVLHTIPEHKKDKVVYINIADEEYSFGFNIFSAHNDAEKTVLASDLASAFADTWISSGDRIQSVLQKTISTFLYSKKEASILDMKRFLLEQEFRNKFLQSLEDPILQFYWRNEFPLVRRTELSPLLLRIDSFMQTRLLRNIFCQTKGIDFRELIEQRKLIVLQLSVGLIGLENSKFLARLIISKINQIAFSRQHLPINERFPIHLYIEEAHYYATKSPVIEQILSGARKYNLNLILVLQHLEQVETKLLNSILTNTATQIFFRLNDKDSRRISPSFSFFEAEDFMELDRGEALVRINKRSQDFNLKTQALETASTNPKITEYIIQSSRNKYAQQKETINEILKNLIPQNSPQNKVKGVTPPKQNEPSVPKPIIELPKANPQAQSVTKDDTLSKQKSEYENRLKKREQIRKHQAVQNFVHTMALQRGFKSVIEEPTSNGGRVDIGLTKDKFKIAVEVSVTNTKTYETKNIIKCIDSGYTHIAMISESQIHLKNIKEHTQSKVSPESFKKIRFCVIDDFGTFLDTFSQTPKEQNQRIQGYRVSTSYQDEVGAKRISKQQELTSILLSSIKGQKKKK